jgi:hypothetical protein
VVRQGGMTREELLSLPVSVDVVTAARALLLGRTKAHELVRAGEFPVPVLRFGNSYRVRTSDLLTCSASRPLTPLMAAVNPGQCGVSPPERRGGPLHKGPPRKVPVATKTPETPMVPRPQVRMISIQRSASRPLAPPQAAVSPGAVRGVSPPEAGKVSVEGTSQQICRRRAASWRCAPLESGLCDPWADQHAHLWTSPEGAAWRAAADHLRAHGFYGRWQVPGTVRWLGTATARVGDVSWPTRTPSR